MEMCRRGTLVESATGGPGNRIIFRPVPTERLPQTDFAA
jgi:hypothetical protein